MTELSPERIKLLKSAVDLQERMLAACSQVFRALSAHPDADVSTVSHQAIASIARQHEVLEAMIDGLHATRH